MAEAEVSGSRFISSKVSVVGESAAVLERWLLVAEAVMGDSRYSVLCVSAAGSVWWGESAAAFEQFVDAAEVGDSRLVWCQKQANAQCGGVSQVAAARV